MTKRFAPMIAMLFALAVSAQIHEKPAKKTIFIDIDEFESHSVSQGAKLATAMCESASSVAAWSRAPVRTVTFVL